MFYFTSKCYLLGNAKEKNSTFYKIYKCNYNLTEMKKENDNLET